MVDKKLRDAKKETDSGNPKKRIGRHSFFRGESTQAGGEVLRKEIKLVGELREKYSVASDKTKTYVYTPSQDYIDFMLKKDPGKRLMVTYHCTKNQHEEIQNKICALVASGKSSPLSHFRLA